MARIKTHLTYTADDQQREKNTLPSKTIPDQTMSVQEIMDRFARGLPLDGAKVALYHEEGEDVPDLERMDLSEKHELLEAARREVQEQREKLNRIAEAKRKRMWNKPKKAPKTAPESPVDDQGDDDSTNNP